MKPIKNKFFCLDCGRTKMLFETEKKANNFIKFNAEEIEEEAGFKPERSYFCHSCSGWHVTSQKEIPTTKSRIEKILEQYDLKKQEKQNKKIEMELRLNSIQKKLEWLKINNNQPQQTIINYDEFLKNTILEFETIKHNPIIEKKTKIQIKIQLESFVQETTKEIIDESQIIKKLNFQKKEEILKETKEKRIILLEQLKNVEENVKMLKMLKGFKNSDYCFYLIDDCFIRINKIANIFSELYQAMENKDIFAENEINDIILKRKKRIDELENEINYLGSDIGYFKV